MNFSKKILVAISLVLAFCAFAQPACAYFNVYNKNTGAFLYTSNPNNNPAYEGDIFVSQPPHLNNPGWGPVMQY